MPHPLDDCRAKIRRTRSHVEDLTRTVEAFLDQDPYELVHRDDEHTGERIISVHVRAEVPSAELATIVGEIAYNLRSALDYLAQQLIRANGQTPTRTTEFPIFERRERYNAEAPRKVRGMSPQAIAFVERLQPFAWSTPVERRPLWILHELRNADAHRELSVVGSALQSQTLTVTSSVQVRIRPVARMSMGAQMPVLPLQDGTELMRIGLVDPAASGATAATGGFGFGVSFLEPRIVYGQPVVGMMGQLTDFVESLVNSDEIRGIIP
jgi:hypothetical protein